MATTPNPASFRNLPNTLNQLTEQYEREELDVERNNHPAAPGLSEADRAAEAIQAFDPKTTMLKGESIDVALGALGFVAPEIAALPISDITRSIDGFTSAAIDQPIHDSSDEKMVTLYRGEMVPGSGRDIPDWIKSDESYQRNIEAEGRWFTSDLSEAKEYAKEASSQGQPSRLVVIEVPESQLDQYRAANDPDAARFVHHTKRDNLNDEFFVTKDIAETAVPYNETQELVTPKSYDDLSPDEQREADEQMRQEFYARLASEPRDPDESILDGTHPMYLDIEEQNIADFERKHSARTADVPRYEITGQLEDDSHGEDRTMIATGLGPNLWSVSGMEPYSYKGELPLVAEVAGASLEAALRDTTLCEGFVIIPLNDAAKAERGEIHDNVLSVALSHDKADDPFARVQPGVDTDILLSNLLRTTHHALSDGAKEERLSEQLTSFLKNAEPQHPALLTTASDFLTSGISKPSEVVDALMMQAKENALRDTDPPRTLQQHLREVLKEGDDPANTLQVINQWHNPANDAAKAEEIRATIAQEWARSLATEGQPPLAIRDSLTLHLPDSDVPGQSHVAISVRVHEEVNHPHLPQRDAEHLAQRSPEVEANRREDAGPRQTEQRLDRTPIEVPGRVSSITSAERNPESPRR
jgi:hypothetical protein